jgi:hypothetical protein
MIQHLHQLAVKHQPLMGDGQVLFVAKLLKAALEGMCRD